MSKELELAEKILRGYVNFDHINSEETVELLPLTIVDIMLEFSEKNKLEFAIDELKYVKTQCYSTRQFKADLLLDAKIKELEQKLEIDYYND